MHWRPIARRTAAGCGLTLALFVPAGAALAQPPVDVPPGERIVDESGVLEDPSALAADVRDPNYRVAVAEDGVHIYNRDIHEVGHDAMAFFPKLGVEADGGHAFYLGGELTKAELAWRLGKRYVQDEPLDWGCAMDADAEDTTRFKAPGHTRQSGKP